MASPSLRETCAAAPAPAALPQQGAHALFTTGMSVALGLLLSVIVARTLGAAGKGILDVTSASAALFALVLGGSLNSAIIHLVARHGTAPAGLKWQLAGWAAVATIVMILVLAGWPGLAADLGLLPKQDAAFWLGFVAVSAGFGIWAAGLRAVLVGRHALISANRIDLAIKLALAVAYAGFALGSVHDPKVFGWAGASTTAALAFILLVAQPRDSKPLAHAWPTLLATALPVHGTNLLHFLNQRADVFFVQALHGAREVGLYTLAVSLAQCVLLVSSALAQPLLPHVSAARSPGAACAATAQACRLFLALGLAGSATLALGGWWLVPLLFGDEFLDTRVPLLLLIPGMIGFGLTNLFIAHFVGVGRSRTNLWISLLVLAVTVVGNFTLTRAYGALGAAITSSAAYLLAGGLSLRLFQRRAAAMPAATFCPRAAEWREIAGMIRRFRL